MIDEYGSVLGIITQEFFEEEQFKNKGKPPYYAAIKALDIIKFLTAIIN